MTSSTTEIVYRWPDGREEVRYRRVHDTQESDRLIDEVRELHARAEACGYESPYFVRQV